MTQSIPMTAVSVTGRIDTDALVPPPGVEVALKRPGLVIWRKDGVGMWFYAFGGVVAEHHHGLDDALKAQIEGITGQPCMVPSAETMLLLVEPDRDARRPRVGWDRLVVPRADADTLDAVAQLLAQSAALDRYAAEADDLLVDVLGLARDLERRGALPLSSGGVHQQIGHILARRLELARWFYTLDRPESAWNDPVIFELHEALADNLELKDRQHAVEYKLEAVEEALDTLTDLWHGRRSLSLEWTVVILILIEIVGAFWAGH
jgi:uncharacterized Rmd1/YagE family protein